MSYVKNNFFFREKEIELFGNFLKQFDPKEDRLLYYFGKSGVGKTALMEQLYSHQLVEESGFVASKMNIGPGSYKNVDQGLLELRRHLISELGMEFPTFDIIYSVMVEKAMPGLTVDGKIKAMRDSQIVSSVVKTTGPAYKGTFFNRLLLAIKQGDNIAGNWWHSRGRFLSGGLSGSGVEILRRKLIFAFAGDLSHNIKSMGKKLVVFIDNFDGSGDNKSKGFDEGWIFNLMDRVTNAAWVVFSKIRPFDNEIKKVHIHSFDGGEIKDFLEYHKVNSKDIADIISHSSRGLPVFLKFGAELFHTIRDMENREPSDEDFELETELQVQRYMVCFDGEKTDQIKVLSVAGSFDKALFDYINAEFISAGEGFTFKEIITLPFIDEHEGIYSVHPLVKEEMVKLVDSDYAESIKFTIFDFYNAQTDEKLSVLDGTQFFYYANEAFSLAVECLDVNSLIDWFTRIKSKAFSWDNLGFWLSMVRKLAEHLESVFGMMNGETVRILDALAALYIKTEDYDDAEELFKKTQAIKEKLYGDNNKETIRGLERLGELYLAKGDLVSAEACYRNIMTMKQDLYGAHHPESFAAIHKLAKVLSDMGEIEEAESLFYRVQRQLQKKLGKDHPETLKSMNDMAFILQKNGETDKAITLYRELIKADEHWEDSPVFASASGKLAALYLKVGSYEEAEELFEQSLISRKKVYGDSHPAVAACMNNMGYLAYKRGDLEEARSLFSNTLEMKLDKLGESHPSVVSTMSNLGVLDYEIGKFDKAAEIFENALITADLMLEEDSPLRACLNNNLGLVYSRLGENEKSENYYRNAEKIKRISDSGDMDSLAITMANMAELKYRMGQKNDSVEMMEEAIQLSAKPENEEKSLLQRKLENNARLIRNS